MPIGRLLAVRARDRTVTRVNATEGRREQETTTRRALQAIRRDERHEREGSVLPKRVAWRRGPRVEDYALPPSQIFSLTKPQACLRTNTESARTLRTDPHGVC